MKKIFILHGWAYSTEKWKPFVDLMKQKGVSSELIAIPGLTEKIDRAWTLDDYVEWLKKILVKEKEVVLLGHSNGGRIAIAFASKYPEKLKQLILIDSAGIYHNELSLRLKRFIFKTFASVGKKITTSEKLKKLLYKLARESDYTQATPQMRQTMVNLISTDLTSQLSQIKILTLIIWGQHDRSTPIDDAHLMNRLIKTSRLFIIDSARHSPQFTHTEEVVQKIIESLS